MIHPINTKRLGRCTKLVQTQILIFKVQIIFHKKIKNEEFKKIMI